MACVVARREAGLTTLEPKGGFSKSVTACCRRAQALFMAKPRVQHCRVHVMALFSTSRPCKNNRAQPIHIHTMLWQVQTKRHRGGSQLKRGSSSHHRGLEPLCLSDRRLRPASMRARQLMHTRKVCSLALRPGHVAKRCSVFPAEERKNLLSESRVCVPGSIVTPPSSDSSESCRTGRWPIRASWDFRGATKHHVTKLATAAEVAATAKRSHSHRSTSMAHGRAKMLG